MQALLAGAFIPRIWRPWFPSVPSRGWRCVIVGGFLNKNLLKFVAQKTITKPGDLRGKKSALPISADQTNLAFCSRFENGAFHAKRSISFLPAAALATETMVDARSMDATVISYDHALIAAQKG